MDMRFYLLLIAVFLLICLACHQRITKTDFNDDTHIIADLSHSEKTQYWKNQRLTNQLFKAYVEAMPLVDKKGQINRASVRKFRELFKDKATVWNDIHPEPFPVSPGDYAFFIKQFMPKGVQATINIYGNYANDLDKRLLQYYKVGEGKHEYYLHLAIEKKIFFGLDENMEVVSYKPAGKTFLLDFITYINNETNEVKIADIKPLLN